MVSLDELVGIALRDGDLYAGGRKSKTLTVNGRRVPRIRVQVAIFTRFYGMELNSRDAWMAPEIDQALAARGRGRRSAS